MTTAGDVVDRDRRQAGNRNRRQPASRTHVTDPGSAASADRVGAESSSCVLAPISDDLARLRSDRELGFPGEFPFTRGIQPTMYRGRLVDDAAVRRVWHGRRVERALSVSAVAGRQRAERRVRPADADRLRLRPSAGRRRGRPRRRRDRLDRGHGGALRRHSARPRVHVDDDQRDRDHPAGAVRRGRQAAGRWRRISCRERFRTTC